MFKVVFYMENILLYLCSCLSCFVIVKILWDFMAGRYNRAFKNKYLYIVIEAGLTFGIAAANLLNIAFVNFAAWVFGVGFCAFFLYYEDADRGLKRILECEVLIFLMTVCESLGVVVTDLVLRLLDITVLTQVMHNCLEIAFSKVILIFLYYMSIDKLLREKNVPFTKIQYIFNFIILIYTFLNIIVIADNMYHRPDNYLLVVNLGCLVLADLYLLYSIRVTNERNFLEYEIKTLEQQANMQYEYYLRQEKKYNQTVQILHDVNKHIKSIEQLYSTENIEDATEYARQIGNILQPLIPEKYTGNPILDILLTDKSTDMVEKSIEFEIKVNNVNLDFIEPIDVTTIFGNLLDNCIEACEKVKEDRKILIDINAYHEMISIRITNSCTTVKWKNGMPVSEKGKDRGLGLLNVQRSIEKYDGNMKMVSKEGMFIVDIFLNS